MGMATAQVSQYTFRFYENASGNVAMAAVDTDIEAYAVTWQSFILRMGFEETSGTSENSKAFILQSRKNGGSWVNVASNTTEVTTAGTSFRTNWAATSQLITTGTFFAGDEVTVLTSGEYITESATFNASEKTEHEWVLAIGANSAVSDYWDFRVVDEGSVVISNYGIFPRVTRKADPPLNFTDYLWRNDDGDLTAATSASAVNTAIGIPVADNQKFRLRIRTANPTTGITLSNVDQLLYFKINGGTEKSVASVNEVNRVDSTYIGDGAVVSNELIGGSETYKNGLYDESGTAILDRNYTGNDAFEDEISLEFDVAALSAGDTITIYPKNTGTNPPEFTNLVFATVQVGFVPGASALTTSTSISATGVLEGVIDGFSALATSASLSGTAAAHGYTITAAEYRLDDGNEASATVDGDANGTRRFYEGDTGGQAIGRLRFLIENTGQLSSSAVDFQMQHRETHADTSTTGWQNLSTSYSAVWRTSTHIVGSEATTKQMTAAGDTFKAGIITESDDFFDMSSTLDPGDFTELEINLSALTNRYGAGWVNVEFRFLFRPTATHAFEDVLLADGFIMPDWLYYEPGSVPGQSKLNTACTIVATGNTDAAGVVSGNTVITTAATVAGTVTMVYGGMINLTPECEFYAVYNGLLRSSWIFRRDYQDGVLDAATTASDWALEVCEGNIGNHVLVRDVVANDAYFLRIRVCNVSGQSVTFKPRLQYRLNANPAFLWTEVDVTVTFNYVGMALSTGVHGWFSPGTVTDERLNSVNMTGSTPEPVGATFVNGQRIDRNSNASNQVLGVGECTEFEYHIAVDNEYWSASNLIEFRLVDALNQNSPMQYNWDNPVMLRGGRFDVRNSRFRNDNGSESTATFYGENGNLLINPHTDREVPFRWRCTVHPIDSNLSQSWEWVLCYGDTTSLAYDHVKPLNALSDTEGAIRIGSSLNASNPSETTCTEQINPADRTFLTGGTWCSGKNLMTWSGNPNTSNAHEMEFTLELVGDVQASSEYLIRPMIKRFGRYYTPTFKKDLIFNPRIITDPNHVGRATLATSSSITWSPPVLAAVLTSGTVTASAVRVFNAATALTPTATITALGNTDTGTNVFGAMAITATGAVAAIGERGALGAGVMTTATTITPAPTLEIIAAMVINVWWNIIAKLDQLAQGVSAMPCTSSASASGYVIRKAKAKLYPDVTLAPAGEVVLGGRASITTAFRLTAKGKDQHTAQCAITATATTTMIGTEVRLGHTTINGTATLTTAAQADFAGTSNLAPSASVSGSVVIVHGAAAALAASASASGKNGSTVPASAATSCSATLTAFATKQRPGSAVMSATVTLGLVGDSIDPEKLRILEEECITIIPRESCVTVIERNQLTTVLT